MTHGAEQVGDIASYQYYSNLQCTEVLLQRSILQLKYKM